MNIEGRNGDSHGDESTQEKRRNKHSYDDTDDDDDNDNNKDDDDLLEDVEETQSGVGNEKGESAAERKLWTREEDTLILDMQKKYGNRWSQISTFLPGRKVDQVKIRFRSLVRACTRYWTMEDDERLLELKREFKGNWGKVAASMGNRTKNACRVRYQELMNMQGGISVEMPAPGSPRQALAGRPDIRDFSILKTKKRQRVESSSDGDNHSIDGIPKMLVANGDIPIARVPSREGTSSSISEARKLESSATTPVHMMFFPGYGNMASLKSTTPTSSIETGHTHSEIAWLNNSPAGQNLDGISVSMLPNYNFSSSDQLQPHQYLPFDFQPSMASSTSSSSTSAGSSSSSSSQGLQPPQIPLILFPAGMDSNALSADQNSLAQAICIPFCMIPGSSPSPTQNQNTSTQFDMRAQSPFASHPDSLPFSGVNGNDLVTNFPQDIFNQSNRNGLMDGSHLSLANPIPQQQQLIASSLDPTMIVQVPLYPNQTHFNGFKRDIQSTTVQSESKSFDDTYLRHN